MSTSSNELLLDARWDVLDSIVVFAYEQTHSGPHVSCPREHGR
jgi:hypothetical protein